MSSSRATRAIFVALSLLIVGAAVTWVLNNDGVGSIGPSCASSFSC